MSIVKQQQIRQAIDQYVSAKEMLRGLNVVRSERLVSEIGEWFFTALFGGRKADSATQKGWDVSLDEKKIQIKTHAKGENNSARWTEYSYTEGACDEVVIIVFTAKFYLKEFYRIPVKHVIDNLKRSKQKTILRWNDLAAFRIDLNSLPRQEIVSLYRAG